MFFDLVTSMAGLTCLAAFSMLFMISENGVIRFISTLIFSMSFMSLAAQVIYYNDHPEDTTYKYGHHLGEQQ